MNRLIAQFRSISSHDQLSLVSLALPHDTLTVLLLEATGGADYLKQDEPVQVMFKPTDVLLAVQAPEGLSVCNQLRCQVTAIQADQILTAISLNYYDTRLYAVLPSPTAQALYLTVGDHITALINASALILGPA